MTDIAPSLLHPWASFYTMTGSAAAALTGLMFVVGTLMTGAERSRTTRHEGNATFSTPTVLHFGVALLVSAVLCAPWRSLLGTGTLLGLTGLWGVVYIIHVMCQARRLSVYSPDLEDWIWYTILPLVAYGAIFAGAIVLFVVPEEALFALAGGVVLLTFIGIRNAWDIVTYIVLEGVDKPPNSSGNDESG